MSVPRNLIIVIKCISNEAKALSEQKGQRRDVLETVRSPSRAPETVSFLFLAIN